MHKLRLESQVAQAVAEIEEARRDFLERTARLQATFLAEVNKAQEDLLAVTRTAQERVLALARAG